MTNRDGRRHIGRSGTSDCRILIGVQLDLPFLRSDPPPPVPPPAPPALRSHPAVHFVRERRARRYILRVRPDGSLRVTIPRGGSRRDAEAFVRKHQSWAERERDRVAACHAPVEWPDGHTIPLRGEPVTLRLQPDAGGAVVVVGDVRVRVDPSCRDLRPAAEQALRHLAQRELVSRLQALATAHGLHVTRASIRNQRSRWGSCSRGGAVALNFRLVQMPPAVCDYVLLHELMHLRQQNHSPRYWRLVEQVCPEFRAAERWLRVEGRSLF